MLDDVGSHGNFIAIHTDLARKYLASPDGVLAFGPQGYLPTAVNRDQQSRNISSWSIMMGLHLLLEEQRLTILSSEDTSPNPSDLRALLCQLAKWLGWLQFQAVYAISMPVEPDVVDSGATTYSWTPHSANLALQKLSQAPLWRSRLTSIVWCPGFKPT